MPVVDELFVYPIKSCAGASASAVFLTKTGFAWDRHWMVVDSQGKFLTQREHPKLALVKPTVDKRHLRVSAPGMSDLSIELSQPEQVRKVEIFGESFDAFTCDPKISQWFSDYLGVQSELVANNLSSERLGGVQYPERDSAPTLFVDNYGVLVISQASHAGLNARLPRPIPVNRFRPNILLGGVDAHDEDHFDRARVGQIELTFINPCYRCNMTSVDQERGMFDLDPLPTLAAYRHDQAANGVKFGNYAKISLGFGEELRVGDQLDVTWTF